MRNLNTKESRLKSREYQFTKLIESGYTQISYKELDFFTKEEGKYFTLKVFRGTAAHHELYMNYHTAERREETMQNYKNNYDRRQTYKAEQKEANKGKSSTHAGASAAIKAELKKEFSNIKFSVTSDSYSGGNSVHISWINGPTVAEVEKFSSKYQYGQFNGMEDIYEYTNSIEGLPQVKYVQEQRNLSDEIINEVAAQLQNLKKYTAEQLKDYRENPEQEAKQILYKTNIPFNYVGLQVVRDLDNNNYNSFYKIEFSTPEQTTQNTQEAQPQYKEVKAVKGEINIVDYSEKAFAIIGDTKPLKDKLKELGGSFNPRLSCGAGWIFSKKKYDEVVKALQPKTEESTQPTEEKESRQHPEFEHNHPLNICDPESGQYKEAVKEYLNPNTHNVDIYKKESNGAFNIPGHLTIFNSSGQDITPENYNNLQDITEAAQNGKIISLCNLAELTNKYNQLTQNA